MGSLNAGVAGGELVHRCRDIDDWLDHLPAGADHDDNDRPDGEKRRDQHCDLGHEAESPGVSDSPCRDVSDFVGRV